MFCAALRRQHPDDAGNGKKGFTYMSKTLHSNEPIQERALLIGLLMKSDDADGESSLSELVGLAETAGVKVLGTLRQVKEAPDPRWLIGKGKVDEVRAEAERLSADTVIFDQELTGVQVRNLEEALDAKIIDRTQLILDIFAQRARTREGILQVELAQLNYLLPRLAGQGKNLSRLGGGIGTRGPGETKLETDRRHIRRRIGELKRQLAEVIRHRNLHRDRRKKTGVFQVALVGYTNAGKSTLLRELTQTEVFVENKLFATLDPLSRALTLPGGKEIVVADTVGFIRNLPHELVAAFRSTLEEVNEADLLLHVVDSSSPQREEQIRAVERVLAELGAQGKERLTIYNKIDLCSPEEASLLAVGTDSLAISAFRKEDIERLKLAIERQIMGGVVSYRIPAHRGELISRVYRIGDVLEQEAEGDQLVLRVRVDRKAYETDGYVLKEYEVER